MRSSVYLLSFFAFSCLKIFITGLFELLLWKLIDDEKDTVTNPMRFGFVVFSCGSEEEGKEKKGKGGEKKNAINDNEPCNLLPCW